MFTIIIAIYSMKANKEDLENSMNHKYYHTTEARILKFRVFSLLIHIFIVCKTNVKINHWVQ
jgi:hypothetical protein